MNRVLVVAVGPVAVLGMLVALMMLGSTTPQSRNRCVQPGYTAALVPGAGGWTIPLGRAYTVTAEFGWRTHPLRGGRDLHTGIDVSTGGGAPVLAAAGGTVSGVTNLGSVSYGLYITIDHGGGLQTRYAHLAASMVQQGQQVSAGQQIGIEGASGGVTGPHLHFETIMDGQPVDPRVTMPARGLTFDGRPGAAPPDAGGGGQLAMTSSTLATQGVERSLSLTTDQWRVAERIVATGRRLGLPSRAWLIALITAMQESDLAADPTARVPNGDGDVGPFQQRALPGWYADAPTSAANTTILNDAAYGAETFYLGHTVAAWYPGGAGPAGYHIPGLVNITGWESMPTWEAAAEVQRPAAQYRTAYARHEATAAAIISRVTGSDPAAWQAAAGCPGAATQAGSVAGDGPGAQAASAALAQVGVPYSWGGGSLTGPTTGICCSPSGGDGRSTTGFDCSGLTRYAWARVGVTLPRTSDEQMAATTPVPVTQIRAGDLLFFPGHVGIADGNGGMIHAPRTGKPVTVTPNVLTDSYYGPRLLRVGRPTTP